MSALKKKESVATSEKRSVSSVPKTTTITIWGMDKPNALWNIGAWKTYLDIDGVRHAVIPMNEKYFLKIDHDCKLTFSLNDKKPVSYNVKFGEDETIQLYYDTTWGGLGIKGKRGNVGASGCIILALSMLSSFTALMSLILLFIL